MDPIGGCWFSGVWWSCCDCNGGLCVGGIWGLWVSIHTACRVWEIKLQQMLWKKELGEWLGRAHMGSPDGGGSGIRSFAPPVALHIDVAQVLDA